MMICVKNLAFYQAISSLYLQADVVHTQLLTIIPIVVNN